MTISQDVNNTGLAFPVSVFNTT